MVLLDKGGFQCSIRESSTFSALSAKGCFRDLQRGCDRQSSTLAAKATYIGTVLPCSNSSKMQVLSGIYIKKCYLKIGHRTTVCLFNLNRATCWTQKQGYCHYKKSS